MCYYPVKTCNKLLYSVLIIYCTVTCTAIKLGPRKTTLPFVRQLIRSHNELTIKVTSHCVNKYILNVHIGWQILSRLFTSTSWAHLVWELAARSVMPLCAVITPPLHPHQTDMITQLGVCWSPSCCVRGSWSGAGCEIAAFASVQTVPPPAPSLRPHPKKQQQQQHKKLAQVICQWKTAARPLPPCRSLPPTETSISSSEPDSRSVSPPVRWLHTVDVGLL